MKAVAANSVWATLCDPEIGLTGQSKVGLRPLVLVAHPDDETIGASVILGRLSTPIVVYLTDGAPHQQSFWPSDANGSRADYARMRRDEAISALSLVDVPRSRILWLGATDQDASFEMPALVKSLARLLCYFSPDFIVTHAYEGGHPDHDTAALVAQLATHVIKNQGRQPPEVLEFPLYHAENCGCVSCKFLPSSQDGGPAPAHVAFPLSPEETARKAQMATCHHSQRAVLQQFPIGPEPLRPAPSYDFTKPPHPGKLWYECLGWPMTGARWRELASAALDQFSQSLCH